MPIKHTGIVSLAALREAKELSGAWLTGYNHHRPRSSLDYRTPAAYVASLGVSAPDPPVSKPQPERTGKDMGNRVRQGQTLITTGT